MNTIVVTSREIFALLENDTMKPSSLKTRNERSVFFNALEGPCINAVTLNSFLLKYVFLFLNHFFVRRT